MFNLVLHMMQYKSIAQVNEAALKQIEAAHEEYKLEVLCIQPYCLPIVLFVRWLLNAHLLIL